ncbi:PerC family transcriptional regulator [Klebsiella pneumoniae]|uniref:PerC family transcriptional regulator n=1 Tax=Klebsiella pneumoniae TaxID=573 RepID=UPI002DBF282C|nr:PerC family transcriptional regulator [Klebsiella pneumoniae]MEC4553338.1 PerC family transcriptional regulator [Klebsiella pneumoniae]
MCIHLNLMIFTKIIRGFIRLTCRNTMRYRESIRGARWMRIRDSIAERLEACGLYRRAASRWIEVMQRCLDDEDREWIRHHRNQCLKKAQRPPAPKEEFADLHQAAKETQYRMGIAKPYGEAFRLPGKGKTAAE